MREKKESAMCNQAIQNQLDGYEDRSISLLDNAKPIFGRISTETNP